MNSCIRSFYFFFLLPGFNIELEYREAKEVLLFDVNDYC